MHAVDFLKSASDDVPPCVVLVGSQRHFKQQCIAALRQHVAGDDDTSVTRFTGRDADLQTVTDELRTVSMWGDRRLVVVDDADDFVSKHRSGLEKYVEHPAKKGVLALDVASWPKTTRLAKQLASSGLEIDCGPLKGAQLMRWLNDLAQHTYQARLDRDAAALLVELIGEEPGLLEQEIFKLSSYVGERRQITIADVTALVGGWRTETTWAMTDAVRDGRLPDALSALHDLLHDGEAPQKLLGGIGFVFRKFAKATELSRKAPLDQALREAGVFPRDVQAGTAYLRRLGRTKAEHIIPALLATDAGLKGGSRLPEHVQLERLLLQLSGAMTPRTDVP